MVCSFGRWQKRRHWQKIGGSVAVTGLRILGGVTFETDLPRGLAAQISQQGNHRRRRRTWHRGGLGNSRGDAAGWSAGATAGI